MFIGMSSQNKATSVAGSASHPRTKYWAATPAHAQAADAVFVVKVAVRPGQGPPGGVALPPGRLLGGASDGMLESDRSGADRRRLGVAVLSGHTLPVGIPGGCRPRHVVR